MRPRHHTDLDHWCRLVVGAVAVGVLVLVMFMLPWCVDEARRSIRGGSR